MRKLGLTHPKTEEGSKDSKDSLGAYANLAKSQSGPAPGDGQDPFAVSSQSTGGNSPTTKPVASGNLDPFPVAPSAQPSQVAMNWQPPSLNPPQPVGPPTSPQAPPAPISRRRNRSPALLVRAAHLDRMSPSSIRRHRSLWRRRPLSHRRPRQLAAAKFQSVAGVASSDHAESADAETDCQRPRLEHRLRECAGGHCSASVPCGAAVGSAAVTSGIHLAAAKFQSIPACWVAGLRANSAAQHDHAQADGRCFGTSAADVARRKRRAIDDGGADAVDVAWSAGWQTAESTAANPGCLVSRRV